jgi:hypothetical protein
VPTLYFQQRIATTALCIGLSLNLGNLQAQTPQKLSSPALTAQPIQPVTKPPGIPLALPDIAFDVGASQSLSTQRYFNLVIKNIGSRASAPFEVQCDYRTAVIPPGSGTTIFPRTRTMSIPAILGGASYQTQNTADDIGAAAFFWRNQIKCVADSASTSGETNKTNNTFEHSPAIATPNSSPPDITFDKQATDADHGNNTLGKVTLKNIGAGASRAFLVKCDSYSEVMLFDGRKERNLSSDSHSIPALAAGASHTTQGMNGAWAVESVKCTADPSATLGESNLANNSYEYRRNKLASTINQPVIASATSARLVAALGAPDLTFDAGAMTADVDGSRNQIGYRIHVQNVGTKTSSPSEVSCTDTSDFSDTTPPYTRPVERRTWTWTRPVPAVAAGARFADQVEVMGGERLVRRTCVIDAKSTSGETNKANNGFNYRSPNAVASRADDLTKPVRGLQAPAR